MKKSCGAIGNLRSMYVYGSANGFTGTVQVPHPLPTTADLPFRRCNEIAAVIPA